MAAWSGGWFGRNDEGQILVSGQPNAEFALQHDEYTLQRPGRVGYLSPYPEFYTRADWVHNAVRIHGRNWTEVNKTTLAFDSIGLALCPFGLQSLPDWVQAAAGQLGAVASEGALISTVVDGRDPGDQIGITLSYASVAATMLKAHPAIGCAIGGAAVSSDLSPLIYYGP
jgi:hypothetical protein